MSTRKVPAPDLRPGDVVMVNPSDDSQDIVVASVCERDGYCYVYEEAMRYRSDQVVEVISSE